VNATEAVLGNPSGRGSRSGSYGSGVSLYYRRPYLWEHVVAALPTDIRFRPFRVTFSDGWYVDKSPEIELSFDERGLLAQVCKRGLASKSSKVVKSSWH